MLISRGRFDDVYESIKLRAVNNEDGCSLLILLAPDCDALCACRIVTSLLRNDNVTFKVQPVSGYGEIEEVAAKLPESIQTVFMLNCGSGVDLTAIFAGCEAQIFVVDNHRPVHLRNVHCSDRVVVLDAEQPEDLPSDGEDLDGELSSDDDDEEEEEEDSDEDSNSSSEEDDEDEKENNEGNNVNKGDDDDDDDELPRKKQRRRNNKQLRKQQRQQQQEEVDEQTRRRKQRLRAYYDGTYDSTPSALLLFSMCEGLYRVGPTECWLAALGLTSMHSQWRVDEAQYDQFVRYLAEKLRQFGQSSNEGNEAQVDFEAKELRFMLHRHWSLFDSMYYSNYVASRLSVWKSEGRRSLQELLAKMGLSLEHCRQKYAFLTPQQQRSMHTRLAKYGPAYRLEEPFVASFRRTSVASGVTLSAADAALLVDAALESTHAAPRRPPPCEEEDEEEIVTQNKAQWTAGVWEAYDALLAEDRGKIHSGIEAACALQRAVVNQAVSMVERRAITTLKHFRYAYIASSSTVGSGGSTPEAFLRPLATRKLALFLTRVHRENGKWLPTDKRPLIILAEKASTETFLVLGLNTTQSETQRQRLGMHFRLAADHIKAQFKQDWFDAALIELEKDNVQRFIESLHYILSA